MEVVLSKIQFSALAIKKPNRGVFIQQKVEDCMHAYMWTHADMSTTKLNKNLFSKNGLKIVYDQSFRHDFYRFFYLLEPLLQKTFDRLKHEDIIQSLDLRWPKTKNRLCKLMKNLNLFLLIIKRIKIEGWSSFKCTCSLFPDKADGCGGDTYKVMHH